MIKSYHPVLDNECFQRALKPFIIQVVAPASGIRQDKLACLQQLAQLQLDFSCCQLNDHISYHSSTDAQRLAQLTQALYDNRPQSIIWALRGGYGSARLIEQLNQRPAPLKEKPFIGFSDLTALNLFFSQQWQWRCVHGAGLSQFLDAQYDANNYLKIADLLTQSGPQTVLDDIVPFNAMARDINELNGCLTGGNLTLVEQSIGTVWQIQTKDKILFLEEIGEKGYRIDRSLYHLYQAGLLQQAKAILLGEFLNQDNDKDIPMALERFAKETPIPVYKSSQFGHGVMNYPLRYNTPMSLQATETLGHFVLLEKKNN